MNLKLKRLVRTPSSEQYALFDLDQADGQGVPATIGKLDLHYTAEGMYGTLLLWDAQSRRLRPQARHNFVHALLREIAQPMGVPNEYVVEFFAPTLDYYEVFHNVAVDDAEEDEEPDVEDDDEPDAAGGADASRLSGPPSARIHGAQGRPSGNRP